MGYNISEVTGFTGSGASNVDTWTKTFDLRAAGDPLIVTGDFDEDDSPLDGVGDGEPAGGYTVIDTGNTNQYGVLNFNTANGEFSFSVDRAVVFTDTANRVSVGGQDAIVVTFRIEGADQGFIGPVTDDDTINIQLVVCVGRGTRVRTPNGLRRVEDLRIGDPVTTHDGTPKPIRWIGSRRLSSAALARQPHLRPVRISADALGPGLPFEDLIVSPQHRILLSGRWSALMFDAFDVLAPARGLVDDARIVSEDADSPVEYFHILFDAHEVIETNGLPTESFLPGETGLSALDCDARREILTLFPQLAKKKRPKAAAPLLSMREARAWRAMTAPSFSTVA